MNKKQIVENNKKIATFMGREVHTDGIGWFDEKLKMFFYQEDWNELMKVVAKIVRDEQHWDNEYREHLCDIVPYGVIEDVYSAVVGFVENFSETGD